MGAIAIKADRKSNKILAELAKKLGAEVVDLEDEQFEDFAMGKIMDEIKTGEIVDSKSIMMKLKSK